MVDPKIPNMHLYNNVFCLTPNIHEFAKMCECNIDSNDINSLLYQAKIISDKYNFDNIVVTLGEKGAFCYSNECHEFIEGIKKEVANTIGAGDTFISMLALSVSVGFDFYAAVLLANVAASIVVSKKYTSLCVIKEVMQNIRSLLNE